MANRKQLEILRSGVEEWNAWRRENLGEAVELSGADLRSAELGDVNLQGADLNRAKLGGAYLGHGRLSMASLRRAILYGADLRRADLSGADLRHTDLQGANLNDAALSGAGLSGADLRGALLNDAILTEADLTSADLTHAYLKGADLRRAGLSGTELKKAIFGLGAVGECNLATTQGLDRTHHLTSTSIGTDTLELTARGLGQNPANRGPIETFLRAAGVSEPAMTYFVSLIENPIEFYSCFISYSHRDRIFARRLYDSLQRRGIRCWLDERQLLPGDDIYDMVDRGIRLWDKVLLCCSEDSLTSWWVEDEIDKALEKERKLRDERGEKVHAIIPLNLDGYLFDAWQDGRASTIRNRLAADFTGWETDNQKLEDQFEKVVQALRTERDPAPEPKL